MDLPQSPHETPPAPPPPLRTRRPAPDDDLEVPATLDSTPAKLKKLTFTEAVKFGAIAITRRDRPHQPQPRLKSILTVPKRSTYSSRVITRDTSHRRAASHAAPLRRSWVPKRGFYFSHAPATASPARHSTGNGFPSHRSSAGCH